MSTDWIEVHDHGSVYQAKVYLTDKDEAYMIIRHGNKRRFFRIDARLLRGSELRFFENIMDNAKELPLGRVFEMKLIDLNGE